MGQVFVHGLCWLWLLKLCLAGAANWTKPNGQFPSFTDTYTVGETIRVSWLDLNASVNDLWLTRYNTQIDDFALRLGVDLNVAVPGYFDWTIAVSNQEVIEDTRFELRFVPEGAAYTTSVISLLSPAFNLILVNQQSPPNGTVSLSPSSTVSATATAANNTTSSTSIAHQPVESQASQSSSDILSTSAKVAIIVVGVAAAIFVIAGIVYAYMAWKRRQRKSSRDSLPAEKDGKRTYEVLGDRKYPVELNSKDTSVYELNSSRDTIISEAGSSPIHEMGNVVKKPGLHEMPG